MSCDFEDNEPDPLEQLFFQSSNNLEITVGGGTYCSETSWSWNGCSGSECSSWDCSQTGTATLYLNDSYGDGWNDNDWLGCVGDDCVSCTFTTGSSCYQSITVSSSSISYGTGTCSCSDASDGGDGGSSFYEDFSDLSDWYNVSGWITTTSYRCVDNTDGSNGTCANFYLPNNNNNPAPTMERDVSVSAGQTLSFYIYTDWGWCTQLYLNDVLAWDHGSDGSNPQIPITQTGNLNIKFLGCTAALTRAWLDDLRIE